MTYVYVLRTVAAPHQFYVGLTSDLRTRVADHNAGRSTHTAKLLPWSVYWYCAFADRPTAEAFELYLKTGSGRAFQKRHLALNDGFASERTRRRK